MNLQDLKNNTIVSMFIDNIEGREGIEETLYSVSKQTNPIDLLVFSNLSNKDELTLIEMLESPKIIVRKKENDKIVEETIETDGKITYAIVKNVNIKTFPELFNETFNVALQTNHEFFSVIEKNDIVGLNWFKTASEYFKEIPETDMFFPIIRNTINGTFSNISNEAPWAEGLSEEAGKIDLNLLVRFNCIMPLGAMYKTSGIKEYSEEKDGKYYPFKESIKISHYYEFFMRMVYNDLNLRTIPRIGYELKTKTDNKFNEYSCKIPPNLHQIKKEDGGYDIGEIQFWADLAKKEYFFDEDRKKEYVK